MPNYDKLEKKYRDKLEKDIDFEKFLDKLLEEYFKEDSIIEELFELRNEENRLISNKEIEIMDTDEKIYNKLLFLCGREQKKQLDDVVFLIEKNKQNLVELYSKEFYMLGFKDGQSIKKKNNSKF